MEQYKQISIICQQIIKVSLKQLRLNNPFNFSSNKIVKQINDINPYLKNSLISNHIYQLKPFQYQMLMQCKPPETPSSPSPFYLLNSCTGSGKTLAYLLPILNHLLCSSRKSPHGAIFLTLNKQLTLQLYTYIRRLDPQIKLNIPRLGPISHFLPVISLISTAPKNIEDERAVDDRVGKNLLDTLKWDKCDGVIGTPHLLWNLLSEIGFNNGNEKDKDKDKQKGKGKDNGRKGVACQFIVIDQGDILMHQDKNNRYYAEKIINMAIQNNMQTQLKKPPTVIISTSSFSQKIKEKGYIQYLQSRFNNLNQNTNTNANAKSKRKKAQQKNNNLNISERVNWKMVQIQGENRHRIPEEIQLFFIQLGKNKKILDQIRNNIQNKVQNKGVDKDKGKSNELDPEKLYYLDDILKKRMNNMIVNKNSSKNQKILIYAKEKKTVQPLYLHLINHPIISNSQVKLNCQLYHSKLDSNSRSQSLYDFMHSSSPSQSPLASASTPPSSTPQTSSPAPPSTSSSTSTSSSPSRPPCIDILVTTDLTSRGLDFQSAINLIIEYEMAENVKMWINRIGRTGRNGVKGQVITFVGNGQIQQEQEQDTEDENGENKIKNKGIKIGESKLFEKMKEIVENGGTYGKILGKKRKNFRYTRVYEEQQDQNKQGKQRQKNE